MALMQIAGNKCRVCGGNIILSSEGKSCAHCETFAHVACFPQSTCDVCGQSFESYEAPKPDPLRDAILPRALRPSKSGGPVLFLAALFVFLIFLAYYGFMHLLASGH
jgi:hypothetical protein